MRPTSLQLFGSGVKRFNDHTKDSGLGPGQYKTRNTAVSGKYNSVLRVAGSASFKTPNRGEQIALGFDTPGPGDYTGEQVR